MKLSLKKMYEAIPALERLTTQAFPGNIAYRIQRNIRRLKTDDMLSYEKQLREIVFVKYECIENPPGHLKPKDPKKLEDFMIETKALGAEELEVDILLIPLDAVKQITPVDFSALEWMFEGIEAEKHVKSPLKKPRARAGK